MRIMRQRLAAMALIGGLTTLGIGLSAGPASANVSECTNYLGSPQSGSLHITGTPAAGSSVTPGSAITVNAAWNDADFNETHAFLVCGSVNGTLNPAMSSENQGVDNNGALTAAATVPADAPAGADICVVTALIGQLPTGSQGQMVSEKLCYTAAEVTTSTTMAPTTTTTTAPAVTQPADVGTTEAGGPAAPAVEPAPAVAPEVVQAPAPAAQLPRTGSNTGELAGLGAAVLAIGGLARFFGRKRPSEA
jgi:LPXTG-motif cell wall-anchored protein